MSPDRSSSFQPETLPPDARLELRQALLGWYDTRSADYPWRGCGDPYRIWISEVMLQQTRVATVVGYYHRFLDRFPTLEALAAASLAEVLQSWEGLGYYSRARNLVKCARVVAARGGFPSTEAELRAAIFAYRSMTRRMSGYWLMS